MPDASDFKPPQPAEAADFLGQVGPEVSCLIRPQFINASEMEKDSLIWPGGLHRRDDLMLVAEEEPAMPGGAKMNGAEQVIVRDLMCAGKLMCLRSDLGMRYKAKEVTGGA